MPPEEAAALMRLLCTAIRAGRSGGVSVDYDGPGYRGLSDSPDLTSMSSEELKRL